MKKKVGLTWLLFAAFLLITIVSLFVSGGYAMWAMRNFLFQQSASNLEARGEIIKIQVSAHLSGKDIAAIDFICKEAGNASKSRITVVSSNGVVLGDTYVNPYKMENHGSRPEIQKALRGQTATQIRFSTNLQKKMMYVALPVFSENNVQGVVRTSLAVAAIEDQIRAIQGRMIFSGFIIFLAAAGISLWLARRISMPIEAMKQGAARFTSGDLDFRLPSDIAHSDEMAGLYDALNRMAGQLKSRMIDVTEQHNEMEAILASMREGLIALDSQGRVIKTNQAAREILDIAWDPGQKANIIELVRSRDLELLIGELLSKAEPVERDISLHRNQERLLHAHGSPIIGEGGNRVGTLLMLSDVTQLRRLENIRQDFAANVSHELKTPLTAVKGFVETLIHGPMDNMEDTRRFLEIIEKHVNRLDAIIEDLMMLARIEQGGETDRIDKQVCRIDNVLQKVADLHQLNAKAKKIKIELDCNDAPRLRMDSILFEQAMFNLLDNAVKYSPEESTVRIECHAEESGVKILFKDEGIGIEKKHIPRLFERFYRVDKARSRKLGGTGLGLAIVKHIVQAHGGSISVESMPGKGSTFELRFPRTETEPPANEPPPKG